LSLQQLYAGNGIMPQTFQAIQAKLYGKCNHTSGNCSTGLVVMEIEAIDPAQTISCALPAVQVCYI